MKKLALLTITVLFMQGWTFALTYDPVSNTYVTESGNEVVTTTTETTDDSDEPVISSVGQSTTSTNDESTTTESATTTTTSSGDWDGSLEYIHNQLDSNSKTLIASLKSNYGTLQKEMDDLFGSKEQSRLASLQCLNIIDEEFDILDQVEVTYEQLLNKVEIVVTDIHSEISALEVKIDEELLDSLDENLQIAGAQNRVDAFNTEYANVINTFYDLSRDELQDVDLIVDQEKDKYSEALAIYDKRVALYEKLEDEYDNFLNKSSFAGALAGPNMQELLDSLNELETYYRSVFISEWKVMVGAHIPDNKDAFKDTALEGSLQAFSNSFSAKADNILGGLYPVEKLQLMHQSMLTIRAAYLQENGTYDCQAFASNQTISNAADELIEEMDLLLVNLNKAVNRIAKDSGELPKDVTALKKALRASLQEEGTAFVDVLVVQEKTRIETLASREGVSRLSSPVTSESAKRQRTVRKFLQAQYGKALSNGTTASFQKKLENAYDKIDNIMNNKKPTGRTKDMLIAIRTVIGEFLK